MATHNYEWMVAGLRCKQLESGLYNFYIDVSGLVARIFIRDPTVWTTCIFEAFKVPSGGIACRETGTWVPLLESLSTVLRHEDYQR